MRKLNKEVIRGWIKEFIIDDKDKWSLVIFTKEKRVFIGDDEAISEAFHFANVSGQCPFNRGDEVEVYRIVKDAPLRIRKVGLSKTFGDVEVRHEGGE